MRDFVITSESVTAGHPDKLCDQISDAVVDAWLTEGLRSGVVAECALASGVVFLSIRAGDMAAADPAALARRVIAEAGYPAGPGEAPTVMIDLAPRAGPPLAADWSARRAQQMVTAFGYACADMPAAMPFPAWAAHRLTARLDAARADGRLDWMAPDATAQIAVAFADRRPRAIPALAFQLGLLRPVDEATLRQALAAEVIGPALAGGPVQSGPETRLVVLADTGPAGPPAHSGLTGRKSADDAYGGFVRRAGPALSGKDPSRIDRIAAYAARQAARLAVAAGLARECEVSLSYIAGDAGPVSVGVETWGNGDGARIAARLAEVLDLRVGAIAERMGLWDLPAARGGRFWRDLATYGHMGRDDLSPPWEDVSAAAALA